MNTDLDLSPEDQAKHSLLMMMGRILALDHLLREEIVRRRLAEAGSEPGGKTHRAIQERVQVEFSEALAEAHQEVLELVEDADPGLAARLDRRPLV